MIESKENQDTANAEKKRGKRPFWKKFLDWWKRGRLISLIILLVLCVVKASELTPGGPINTIRENTFQPLQSFLFDFYQVQKPREAPENQERPVVIVDIDDESLASLGQWPWPRDVLTKMLQNLMQSGAISVGFDVIFAEEDRLSPNLVASRASARNLNPSTIKELEALPSNDAIFANSLKQSRVVLGQAARGSAIPGQRKGLPSAPPLARKGAKPYPFLNSNFKAILRNFKPLEKATPGLGMLNVEPDPDGIVRKVPIIIKIEYLKKNGKIRKKIYPTLTLEMLRQATGKPKRPLIVFSNDIGITKVALTKDYFIPTEPNGEIWVYYAKPGEQTNDLYVSAKDVISGLIPPERFKNKFVLVGTSAVGLRDIRATPISNNLPGVEVHANMLETILFKTPLTRGDIAPALEIIIAIFTGILLIILLPTIGASWSLLLVGIISLLLVSFSWFSFAGIDTSIMSLPGRELIDFSFFAIAILILYSYLTYTSFSATSAEKKQVRGAFAQYLSPALVEQLADEPDRLILGGEMKNMTFLFCDVRGFTAISETFKTNPQGLTSLINKFLTPMTDIIMERKGTIDKYMGDCIMAFWNAPIDDPDHAKNGVRSALAMFDESDKMNEVLKIEAEQEGRKYIPLRIGAGLNTGICCVGNMGSDMRFDYSVLGDDVNLAARLEGQSKTYGVNIVLGQSTYEAVQEFACLELDRIQVKGKTVPVDIFCVLGDEKRAQSSKFKILKALGTQMISAYRSQEWKLASTKIIELQEADENKELEVLCELYRKRIEYYQENPPGEGWDGAFIATSK